MISPFSLPQASLRGGQRPSGRPGGGPEGGTGAIGAAAEAGYPHGWFYVMEKSPRKWDDDWGVATVYETSIYNYMTNIEQL